MQTAIIKVVRMHKGSSKYWLSVIKELQDKNYKVMRDFRNKKADLNIVLSGTFENPRGFNGKRVMVLEKREWTPSMLNGWDYMYRDIVKHYYDDIIDVTGKKPQEAVRLITDYIHHAERQWNANQSRSTD